jgi:phage baseplate assembly protein W
MATTLPLGIKMPYRGGGGGYFLQTHSDMERALTNLKMLLMTAKGERPMMPTYGSDLRELLFEPNMEEHTDELFEDAVKETTAVWMPEAIISYVKVERDLINTPNNATLRIGFSVTSIPYSEQILTLEI